MKKDKWERANSRDVTEKGWEQRKEEKELKTTYEEKTTLLSVQLEWLQKEDSRESEWTMALSLLVIWIKSWQQRSCWPHDTKT